jgi:tRNA-dihydrouridine synthase A
VVFSVLPGSETASVSRLPDVPDTRLSVAPMMDRTDRHFRFLLRLLSPNLRLYTEMVVAQALEYGDQHKHLLFDSCEHPVALQLGGSDPFLLGKAAALGQRWGYDEINLNVGCPSDRVQSGRFGACLMGEPQTVADCIGAMNQVTQVPVTVKTRIGIDEHDDYGFLRDFVGEVAAAGCEMFIVHARKAILAGLSPKENRSVPPLRYDVVYRLKRDFPGLRIVLNGGVRDTPAVRAHLRQTDGVMIGRQAYSDPYWLVELQRELFGCAHEDVLPDRRTVVMKMAEYADRQCSQGVRLSHITRHMLGLYAGQPGARNWRRYVSESSRSPTAGSEVLLKSLEYC